MVQPPNGSQGLTLTVLGCGTLGTAILSGIFDSLDQIQQTTSIKSLGTGASGTSTPRPEDALPARLPTQFRACVRRHESGKRVRRLLSKYSTEITIHENDNLTAVEAADVLLLACKPQAASALLGHADIIKALQGKLLLSICAGLREEQIYDILYPSKSGSEIDAAGGCRVVRVMPNTASAVRESMSVVADQTPPLPSETTQLIDWIFTRIGKVVHLPSANMDACTALCGSGPAFMALVLEAIADGAVAMGLPRAEAQFMAAQTMRGTASLVLEGEHPAILRDKVSTPGGCTIGGLLVLEEGRVRGALARSVRLATDVASQLGQGVQGVNGTRFTGTQPMN